MKFAERIDNLPASCFREGQYQDGWYECRDYASEIAGQADKLISKLFDALCNRHADDLVDKLKEEYGYDC
jgi:hypothetical protein